MVTYEPQAEQEPCVNQDTLFSPYQPRAIQFVTVSLGLPLLIHPPVNGAHSMDRMGRSEAGINFYSNSRLDSDQTKQTI